MTLVEVQEPYIFICCRRNELYSGYNSLGIPRGFSVIEGV